MAGPRGVEAFLLLAALAGLAALVLWIGALLAARARKPAPRKPPRKTFEHGRRMARLLRIASTETACAALKGAPVGELQAARGDERAMELVVRRRKNQPCEQTAGYVAGLFESAWAHEVVVGHPVCAGAPGGDCVYVVQRAWGGGPGKPQVGVPPGQMRMRPKSA
ncbi:MAG TPA: hypothetical protein VM370_05580 [Candidatus Thermoplasmatota archaeon]|nr:hypothetical protein [Candidatus Thermoplasmatota archaeon]